MIRVLVLCEYPSLNGGEHSLLEVAKRLDRQRVALRFAVPPTGPLADSVRQCGWPLSAWQCRGSDGDRPPATALRSDLAHLIGTHHPDLLHANSVSMARLAGPVARARRLASVGYLRDMIKLSRAAIADLECHDCLIAVSTATQQWYQQRGVSGTPIRVLYNGVDLERFHPGPSTGYLHRELGIQPSLTLVGTIGQIGPRKGTDVFLAAAARIAARTDAVHFVVVGRRYSEKDESREFEQRTRAGAQCGALRGRVHWLGVRTDVHALLRELTIYVHAARQEPLGRVILEASASGLAAVVTDVGGTAEICGGAPAAALLVPPDSAEDLANAIERCLENPVLRAELGRRARLRAETSFNVQRAAQQLDAVYRDVADRSRTRASSGG